MEQKRPPNFPGRFCCLFRYYSFRIRNGLSCISTLAHFYFITDAVLCANLPDANDSIGNAHNGARQRNYPYERPTGNGAIREYDYCPALGAFLFAFIPIEYLILLDVLGAIIGICILTWVQIPNNEKIDQPMHVLHNTRLGIKQLTNNKGLWYITLIGAVFTLTYMPAASIYPLMTMKYFQGTVSQAGLIEAIYSIGMLIGGTIIGLFG
ncbi:hypothetical protein C5L18_000121 [Lactobacillus amylolyticus]|nr:multidrug efflux pump [Lactobacillus amylolyticus DSM 11664]TDG61111.1 hypothetical protein C5L18_000121 [Lactobacillus amylolyticus]